MKFRTYILDKGNNKMKIIIVLIIMIIVTSCTSLVYSPSINLPEKIKKDETKIIAGYESLPSTSEYIDNGLIAAVQHSYSDRFCMQVKYWSDFNTYSNDKNYLHGASINSYFLLNDTNSSYKLYLVPTVGISLKDNIINMGVIGSYLGIQTPQFYFLKPYAALGFLYGRTDLDINRYFGFGAITNIGTNIHIYKNLNLNIEYSLTFVYDGFWKSAFGYGTPTIIFNYGF